MPRQYTLQYITKKKKAATKQTRFITVKHKHKNRVIPISPRTFKKRKRTVATKLPQPTPLKHLTPQTSYKELTNLSTPTLASLKAKITQSVDYNEKDRRKVIATIEQAQQQKKETFIVTNIRYGATKEIKAISPEQAIKKVMVGVPASYTVDLKVEKKSEKTQQEKNEWLSNFNKKLSNRVEAKKRAMGLEWDEKTKEYVPIKKPEPETSTPFLSQPVKYVPKKQKIKVEHKTKQETKMTYLERAHLLVLAKKYDVDRAEIDHKITYDENKEYLEKLAKQNAYSNTELDRANIEADKWSGAYKDFIEQVGEDDERWKDYFDGKPVS